jgi:hypothetical protein
MTNLPFFKLFPSFRARLRVSVSAWLILCLSTGALAAGPSRWTQTSESDFRAGTFVDVVATNLGDLKLSRATKTLLEQDPRVSAVYALAQTPDGTVYAGTGPQGVVLRVKDDKVDTALTVENSVGVFSLAVDGQGRLLVGTGGETGHIYRVDKPDDPQSKPVELYSSSDVQYVWAMKVAPDGTTYAATGPNGQLVAITPDAKASILFDSTESNLLSLAYDGKQTLFAGTDPNGIVYRVDTKSGKAQVLYDADETEVACLAVDAWGNLYAGTGQASEGEDSIEETPSTEQAGRPEAGAPIATAPPGEPKPPEPNPGRPEPEPRDAGKGAKENRRVVGHDPVPAQDLPEGPEDKPAPPGKEDAGGDVESTTSPSMVATGGSSEPGKEGNAIYRIDPQGFVTEVFRHNSMFLSIVVETGGTLLVGTGSDGAVYSLNPAAEENVVVAKLDPKQVMTMLPTPDGRVVLGLANAGGIATLSLGHAATGTFTSDVLDATQVSRFGTMQMHGSWPTGTGVTVATRSGNLKDGNTTEGWSSWSDETPAADYVKSNAPPGRFFQYRLTFKSDKPDVTPTVTDVVIPYRVPNLPPAVKSIKVEPTPKPETIAGVGGASADAEQPALPPNRVQTLTWEASDPNSDELSYKLYYRMADVAGPWILLKEDLKETTCAWDTRTVADGRYVLRVVASDASSNPGATGRTSSRVSDPVVVDNTAPVFDTVDAKLDGTTSTVTVKATDKSGTIASIEYAVDSSKTWQSVAVEDDIFDAPTESTSFQVPNHTPGPHQIAVRATDAAGNEAYANLSVTVGK